MKQLKKVQLLERLVVPTIVAAGTYCVGALASAHFESPLAKQIIQYVPALLATGYAFYAQQDQRQQSVVRVRQPLYVRKRSSDSHDLHARAYQDMYK